MLKEKILSINSLVVVSAFVLCSLLIITDSASACSSFCLKDDNTLLFGNNFDFRTGTARVVINKRGVSKTALVPPGDIPAKWVSKYGSITFDQVGWDFPYQGMNEAGLVVAQMWLDDAKFSPPDERAALTELQWIQYQLDTSKTVDDVITSDKIIRITQNSAPLHYLVCDSFGKIAAIEFLNGKLVVSTGNDMPYPALTNDPYASSRTFTDEYKKNGNLEKIEKTPGNNQRFGRVAAMLINYHNQKNNVEYAFDILNEVSWSNTKYSEVFDIKNGKIYYKTLHNQKIRTVQMKDFDYSCKTPVLMVDIENDLPGGKDDFQIYTIDMNRELIEKIMTEHEFLKQVLSPVKEFYINYPKSLVCTGSEN